MDSVIIFEGLHGTLKAHVSKAKFLFYLAFHPIFKRKVDGKSLFGACVMATVVAKVLATVNAPYGANLSAHQLALCVADFEIAEDFIGPAFSFFSEVSAQNQHLFIEEMHINPEKAAAVAKLFSENAGYTLPLAA